MKIVKVKLKKRSYNIIVASGILKSIGSYIKRIGLGPDAYIITNHQLKDKYGAALNTALKKAAFTVKFKTVADSEQSKSIETVYSVIKDIAAYDKKRRIFIIAFGGGVIGDLAGFVASVYKRGTPYIQVPTTLLAQVDSSIGGKTAVDLTYGKNLVVAFYQPRLVFSDMGLLKTLDARQLKSGLAEVIKYAIIKDQQLFGYLERRYKDILGLKQSVLQFIVERSSAIKAKVVQKDEKEEKGIRTILNFGHTLGHAIEAACDYRGYNHGEAVALGMLVATDLSRRLGMLKDEASKKIERLIKNVGLPTNIKGIRLKKIIRAYQHDKKFIASCNRFVLIQRLGKTKIVKNIPLKIVEETLKKRMF